MSRQWILVADASCATLYIRPLAAGGLEVIDSWAFQPAPADWEGDRRRGATMEPAKENNRQDQQKFAEQIAEGLRKRESQIERLLMVAPPKMLGDLRPKLHGSVRAKIEGELAKDLTHESVHTLPRHLDKLLKA